MDLTAHYDLLCGAAEAALETYFDGAAPAPGLNEAMRYSLFAGGKRVRCVLAMAFCEACGGDAIAALDFACGVEMLHTYSLIHDDLPCMDDDDLRRGKPTNHKVYGECTATLAGDALQAAAFYAILSSPIDAEKRAAAALCLAEAAGEKGMCAGQYLDMLAETQPPDEEGLRTVERYKTAALITAACKMGVIAAGGNDVQLAAAARYAEEIGIAFQIKDDVLDVQSTAQILGKPIGSDQARGKPTFVSLMGIEAANRAIETHTAKAVQAAESFPRPKFLVWLANMLAGREK